MAADDRYSTNPATSSDSHITRQTLRELADRPSGTALDIGAGEGADAIRLARLGYEVTAVDISVAAGEKIERFAAEAGVNVRVQVADIARYQFDDAYDVVICNGVLHYVADKAGVVRRMQEVTNPGGLNVISLWSTYTPYPRATTVCRCTVTMRMARSRGRTGAGLRGLSLRPGQAGDGS